MNLNTTTLRFEMPSQSPDPLIEVLLPRTTLLSKTTTRLSIGLAVLASFVCFALRAEEANENTTLEPHNSPHVWVEPGTGLLTVVAHDVVLAELIVEISQSTATAYVLKGPLSESVTVQFDGLTLHEAMTRLLRRKNYTLQFTPVPTDARASSRVVQNRLWVFGEIEAAAARRDAQSELPRDAQSAATTFAGLAHAAMQHRDAVPALLETEEMATVAVLAAALRDGDAAARHEAAYALAEIDNFASIGLLERVLADPDPYVREAAVDALADIGGEEAAHALALALQDEDAGLREDALYGLADIGGRTAITLLEQARNDSDGNVRETAAELLSEVGE